MNANETVPLAQPDFAALVEAAGDIIYTLDLEGHYTYYNRAAAMAFGYEGDDTSMIGKSFMEGLTPESAATAYKHFTAALKGTERTPFFEVEIVRVDGTIVHLEVRSGMLMRDGKLIGRQGIARNITEIKTLQALVSQKFERLQLLEERARLAQSLYTRIADLAYGDTEEGASNEGALREVARTLQRHTAERHGISAADIQVLRLVAKGLSNDDIAKAICRSPHTVKDNIKRIMQRLGARRRAEAVACGLKLGLITLD